MERFLNRSREREFKRLLFFIFFLFRIKDALFESKAPYEPFRGSISLH